MGLRTIFLLSLEVEDRADIERARIAIDLGFNNISRDEKESRLEKEALVYLEVLIWILICLRLMQILAQTNHCHLVEISISGLYILALMAFS